jgi:hypothetical protein
MEDAGGKHQVKIAVWERHLVPMEGDKAGLAREAPFGDGKALARHVQTGEITAWEMLVKIGHGIADSGTKVQDTQQRAQMVSCHQSGCVLDLILVEELWLFPGGPDILAMELPILVGKPVKFCFVH